MCWKFENGLNLRISAMVNIVIVWNTKDHVHYSAPFIGGPAGLEMIQLDARKSFW